jgi:acyl carrier protein
MITPDLKHAILDVLKLEEWDIRDETRADQIPGWDSLSHVSVISAIEQRFQVRFKGREVLKLKSIGDLQRLLDSKLQHKDYPQT